MTNPNDPSLLVLGVDLKRLQWLSHHVTTRWPNAVVSTVDPANVDLVARTLEARDPDAVILLIDFAREADVGTGFARMAQLLRLRSGVSCLVLAENGDELTAVKTLKCGAKDYLPLAGLTGEALLAALADACARHRSALLDDGAAPDDAVASSRRRGTSPIHVPGYAIVKAIATSNFSAVYLARSERIRRNVVLKVIHRGSSTREMEDAERFQREYEIISSITHRTIAEIHAFGALPDHLYLAMEYFPCGDLRDRLRNPLSMDESRYYLRTLAEALRVIHVFGILHRDLKPANVMLREDNAPVLIDFGLARRAVDSGDMTGVGQVLGSPYYISPEQSLGQRVDCRTDLYSLGVMFYEMLTGQRPYVGRSAVEVMAQHAEAPVPKLPPELSAQQPLLDRLMAKRAEQRYASADELLAELDPHVSDASCAIVT
jgi:tRNA A-37 threonylcarbamoyl transferase component Bud32/ActR/RegA family two-component response regulator